MRQKVILVFFFIIFCSSGLAIAQTGDIRGFVYEQETSEPAIYTSVFLSGTTYGSQSNVDGYYTITKIKPGIFFIF